MQFDTKIAIAMLKWPAIALAVVVVIVALYKLKYPTYSYRYRMIVNVEVDGQLRSGLSVIEVNVGKQPVFLPDVNPLTYSERGEAALVDLGNGRNVVALLAFGAFAENWANPAHLVTTHFKMDLFDDRQLASLHKLRGRWELDDLPTLVTFSNPNDPATVRLVSAYQLEQTFGPGVRWRGVVIEMTTDPVTVAIEAKLPWVTKLTSGLSGSSVLFSPGKFTLNGPYFKRR
jgi:hypothetical protein